MAARTSSEWRNVLARLYYRGQIRKDENSNIGKLLHAFSDIFAASETAADVIINAIMPDTTTDADGLTDWERVAALPEPCLTENDISQTESERQAALLEKLGRLGAVLNIASIDAIILAQGFNGFVVDEQGTTRTGVARCGDSVCAGLSAAFVFTVDSNETNADRKNALECLVNQEKPAHTEAVFTY